MGGSRRFPPCFDTTWQFDGFQSTTSPPAGLDHATDTAGFFREIADFVTEPPNLPASLADRICRNQFSKELRRAVIP
ncbi:hypothetical protein A6X21_03590 [Planctopirus hydrillae]|uniref:Uncharacterized protein n=1 Tax=Planctopirus hydrillae TaxID=1841610 RepID=A0A1C3END3_9PLAN|nr:hypothetical protein A6X21_03590 [Planctopirus hydrillae]